MGRLVRKTYIDALPVGGGNCQMTTGKKLAIAGLIVVGVTGYLAWLGASSSWQYYVTVDECLADSAKFGHERIRVSGKVASGSLKISDDRRRADFALEGTKQRLAVLYAGPLPDKLAEGGEVVVEGRLEGADTIRGEKVLTRCASKYKSQAATAALPGGPPATGEKRP
jgi:cytochrome c-type biogenesis protein CcmE